MSRKIWISILTVGVFMLAAVPMAHAVNAGEYTLSGTTLTYTANDTPDGTADLVVSTEIWFDEPVLLFSETSGKAIDHTNIPLKCSGPYLGSYACQPDAIEKLVFNLDDGDTLKFYDGTIDVPTTVYTNHNTVMLGAGNDTAMLEDEGGPSTVWAGAGDDVMFAVDGKITDSVLHGEAGQDSFYGGAGDDQIFAADDAEKDIIYYCGAGEDQVHYEQHYDTVGATANDCENISQEDPATVGTVPSTIHPGSVISSIFGHSSGEDPVVTSDPTVETSGESSGSAVAAEANSTTAAAATAAVGSSASVSIRSTKLSANKRGTIKAKLSCTATGVAYCEGTLRLRSTKKIKQARGKSVYIRAASKKFKIAAGKTASVNLKLTSRSQRQLKRATKTKVRATAQLVGSGIKLANATKTLTLKLSK